MNTDTKPAALTEKARHLAMLQDMRAYSANDFQKPALDYAIAALHADDAATPPAKAEAPPVDGMVLVVWDDLRKAYEAAAEYTGEWCIGIDDELIRRCDEARTRLAAAPATAKTPPPVDGMVLVPRESTEAMLAAAAARIKEVTTIIGMREPHYNVYTATPAGKVDEAMVDRACRVVAERAGEDFDHLGDATQSILRETQRAALTAALHPEPVQGENDHG